MQTLIKSVGPANTCPEDGEDILHGLSHIPGFKFGYVEIKSKQYRVVTFHEDTDTSHEIKPGHGLARVIATS